MLDLCCGTGESALAAARAVGPSGSVTAVDVARPMLALAEAKAAAAGLDNVAYQEADATRTGLPGGSFDVVVCVFGVFFAADMAGFVAEMWRLVAPGGVLTLTTWGPDLLEPGNTEFWNAVATENPALDRRFNPWDKTTTPDALRDLMASGGVPDPVAVAIPGQHPLAKPEAFWDIVYGSGYRGTIDALDAEARARVRRRVADRLRSLSVTALQTNVVYGSGHRSAA